MVVGKKLIAALLVGTLIPVETSAASASSVPVSSSASRSFDVATVGGTRVVWNVVELSLQHDVELLEGGTPNPFFDFRLDATFTHADSGSSYVVPGFFDCDGAAAESGTTKGDIWRVRFVPDQPGTWDWSVSFRTGSGVAVDDDALAGSPVSFDGCTGSFIVLPADPNAPGLHSKGMLRYQEERYLRFAWTEEAFLKAGADSPENLLGYWEFDGTVDTGGSANALDQIDGLHHFTPHLNDYDALGGGPTWKGEKGKALIGGLNYLASAGVNSVYFLTYNIDGGDGGEVFPWASTTSKLRYDVSKLSQWELVFDHMTDLGIVMHLVLQETENDHVLDFGVLGDQRKLYHRELIARFACNLGLVWNLGEETTNSDVDRKSFATHIRSLDPYDHPIAVHTAPTEIDNVYTQLLGFPDVELCSLQIDPEDVRARTLEWTAASTDAGRPWIVTCDEQNPPQDGVVPDSFDPDHFTIRSEVLWGNLLAGGGGAEFYFGYGWPHDDLDCEDWRTRDIVWQQANIALTFMRDEVDYAAMRAADELTARREQYCLAEDGEAYVIYTPDFTPVSLDLKSSADTFSVSWLNARKGGAMEQTTTSTVTGPGVVALGSPPLSGRDWVVLVRKVQERLPVITSHAAYAVTEKGETTILVELQAEDADGPNDIKLAGMFLFNPLLLSQGFYPFQRVSGGLWAGYLPAALGVDLGTWRYTAGVVDSSNRIAFVTGTFDVE